VVEYARALGQKVAIVAYDDGDSRNENGPINSVIFAMCWQLEGKPSDLFEMARVGDVTPCAIKKSE
jgi:hypothetical protein